MATSVNLLTTTDQPIFDSATNTAITFMSYCNNSAATVTINVYVVPAGETVGPNCLLYAALQIPPYDTYQIYVGNEKLILAPGDMIYASADVDFVVNVVTSYTSI
jgi:hypothetical protein